MNQITRSDSPVFAKEKTLANSGDTAKSAPVLIRMSDVEARPVKWLWPNRIPAGRITLLVGMPGAGKSYLTTDMAARISTGTLWPDGSDCPRGSVILVSAEDDPSDTIRPRLDAHRADSAHVVLLSAIRRRAEDGRESETMFTLADVDILEQALKSIPDCRLIVVDPIGSYLGGKTDSHRDNEVRSVLAPVARLAEQYGPAVLVVAHRRKSTGTVADDMALGSRAFTGIARAVWHLSADSQDKQRRLLLPGKCNLAASQPGLAFSITGQPGAIEWQSEPVDMTADEALAREQADSEQGSALDEAKAWLQDYLSSGPKAGGAVQAAAKATGISNRTLSRAKKNLGVKNAPDGFGGPWVWSLPESPESDTESPESANINTLANTADTGAKLDEWGGHNDINSLFTDAATTDVDDW